MSIFHKARALALWAVVGVSIAPLYSQEKAPDLLASYLPIDKVVKGNIVTILPPEEIRTYVDKVKAAAEKNPEWYEEYSKNSKQGVPLPFHENLGLTKEEYDKYRELWSQRKHSVIQPIDLRLEALGDRWMIRFAAKDLDLTLLRYNAKEDAFDGIGGKLARIKDIDADAETMLGAWTGQEWKFEKESLLGQTKENFAIGREKDGKHGIIIYRLKNTNRQNRILAYENILIRFPLGKGK